METLGRQTEVATAFPARLNTNCPYCDHRAGCPAYAEALKGTRDFVCPDLADLEAVAKEREEVARLAKVLYARKDELEAVLKAHLKEQEVHRFREVMPDAEIKRGLQYRSGEEAPDVDVPCFFVEAKHHHRTNVRAALEQATAASPKGRWPIAVCKDDRKSPLVAMDLEDFLDLLGEWWRGCCR